MPDSVVLHKRESNKTKLFWKESNLEPVQYFVMGKICFIPHIKVKCKICCVLCMLTKLQGLWLSIKPDIVWLYNAELMPCDAPVPHHTICSHRLVSSLFFSSEQSPLGLMTDSKGKGEEQATRNEAIQENTWGWCSHYGLCCFYMLGYMSYMLLLMMCFICHKTKLCKKMMS